MSSLEIISKIESLKEWEALAAEAAAEIESIKDSIKHELNNRGVEELEAGQYIARFTTVLTNRFDTTVHCLHPEIRIRSSIEPFNHKNPRTVAPPGKAYFFVTIL